jgi:sugar/nucleoside kinase (ribokinase family)
MEDFFTAAFQTELDFKWYPAIPADVVNVTGAGELLFRRCGVLDDFVTQHVSGDSMIAGIVWGICQGWDVDKCVKAGLSTAKLSVESPTAISPLVSSKTVEELIDAMTD